MRRADRTGEHAANRTKASSAAKTLLFLCTGNYYRSRFAEVLFNSLAEGKDLAWRAVSRGLAIEFGADNVGPMSADARTIDRPRHPP